MPEAQLDRFLFKVAVPGVSAEVMTQILTGRRCGEPPAQNAALSAAELDELFALVDAVFLPQAVKRLSPACMEREIELMKTTTLVATVSYADLLFQANELAQKTFRPLEVFTVVALMYFTVIFGASLLAHRLERRLAVSGESTVR